MRRQVFQPQIEALQADFRIIAPDLRGHGSSSHIEDGQGIDTLADDLIELLDHLDLDEVIFVGWSMGAMVAWDALQRPGGERIAGIVSIDMVPRILNDVDWQHGLRDGKDASVFDKDIEKMLEDWGTYTQRYMPKIFGRDKGEESIPMIEAMTELTRENDPESMVRLWRSISEQDFREEVQSLTVPSLIVHGALSHLYSDEASEWMEQNVPNSRRVVFTNSGHAPHLEEADRFNKEIRKFAADISNRQTSQESKP